LCSAGAWMKSNSFTAPMAGEKERPLQSILHGLLSMNRQTGLFHSASKVKSDVDVILFIRVTGQDCNRCAWEEAVQIFLHGSLRVIEKSNDFVHFPYRQCAARLLNIHEKAMPARVFEIQTKGHQGF